MRNRFCSKMPALLVLFIAALWVLPASAAPVQNHREELPAQAGSTVPVRDPESPWLVVDTVGVLGEDPANPNDQADRFQFDLRRLQGQDVEAIIYIRNSNDDRDMSQMIADAMLQTWNVESSPGAGDGLVMLVTISEVSPRGGSLVLAYGPNTFPVGQLEEGEFLRVYEEEMVPRMRQSDPIGALTWGVRRLVYYAEYTPPHPAPIDETQRNVKVVADALGPVVPQAAILFFLIAPVIGERRLTLKPSRYSLGNAAILIGTVSVLVGILALFSRSRDGLFGSLAGLAIAGILGLIMLETAPSRWNGRRRVRVSRPAAPTRRLPMRSRGARG